MQQNFRDEAIPLVTFEQDSEKYNINEEAVDFIKSIPAPIGVIAVAGLYRTGKSYLLNRMLLNRSNGFGVGPTVNPCTKGLWVWGAPIKGYTPEGELINILIVDSEGIGALDEDQTHDNKIFSLAILLSSQFIYNSVGSIDENAIQNLSLVVNLTKHIQIRQNSNDEVDSDEYSSHFPSFFWVIRDFSLQLCDQEGEPISSQDYLENSLKEQRGFSDEVEQKNRIRRLLTSFFKDRECITLVRPLVNEENLQQLDKMELDQLRPEFFEQVMGFRKSILSQCRPKTMNGKTLNGEMYISLIQNYVHSINDGAVPNIENAWNYVCKDQCYKAAKQAMEIYEKNLKENLYPKLPTTFEELKYNHKIAKEAALEVFKKCAVGDILEEYQKDVVKKIKDKFYQLKFMNEKESKNCAQNFIQREFQSIEAKLRCNEYKSYADYERDIRLFYQFLLEQGPKIVNRQLIYLDFLQKMLHEGATLFLKNASDNLEIQKECSEEQLKNIEQDLKELKEDNMKIVANSEQKINDLQKQNLEMQNNDKRNEETIKEQQEQLEKIEEDLKNELQKEKVVASQTTNQLQERLAQLDEELQNAQRDLLIKESAFNKEKALLEHKAQHFEELVNQQNQKEQEYDNNIDSAKNQLNSQIKQMQEKFEQLLKDEKTQNQILVNKLQDTVEQKENTEKTLEQELEILREKNQLLTTNLEDSSFQLQSTRADLDRLLNDHQKQSSDIQEIINNELQSYKAQNSTLTQQTNALQESLKQKDQEQKKQEALLTQKIEFLQTELQETKDKLEDQRTAHQSTLSALENSALEQQRELLSKQESKQLLEMKEVHMKEMQNLEAEFTNKQKSTQEKLEQLTKEHQDLDLELKVLKNDTDDEITSLKENLQITEQQRNELQSRLESYESGTQSMFQESEQKYIQKIQEQEQQLEEMTEKMHRENHEMQVKSEEALAQLKNFYEIEKERLENRLIEEKEKREAGQEGILEEYEERLREQSAQYEEEIEYLKEDLRESEMQLQTITGQYEHELDLKIKNNETLEKMLSEAKEQLANAQKNFNNQNELQQAQYQKEKQGLAEKVETLSSELQRKEKDLIKIQQKKESIEGALQRKEELWQTAKTDLIEEKNQVTQKLDETKKNYQKLQDEFLQNKINYEKSIALSTQQNEFFGKKVEEQEKQLEMSSQRYEERIKSQKQEWQLELNDKLGRLQEEKQSLESKYETLKKGKRDVELTHNKKISALEKEKAIIQEKLNHVESKLKETSEKTTQQIESLTAQLHDLKSNQSENKKSSTEKIEDLKKQINTLETEKHELQSGLERDKVLWEGKFDFLKQQKEQAKADLQEVRKNFELTLAKLKEARNNDQSEHQQNVSEMLVNIENKYQGQIKELEENKKSVVQEYQTKLKKLESELKQYQDKNLLEQHSKNSNQNFTEKKLQEMFDNEKKLLEQIERAKQQKEQVQQELMKRNEKEKDQFKQKLHEIEEKTREGEKKRSTLIFEHEKERAKWNLEKDHLLSQRNDLSEQFNRSEKKREQLLRENERIKNSQRHQNRFNNPNVGTSFNLNISRNMGSDRKSPISNRNASLSGQQRGSYTNYSMMNSSFQNNDENDLQNKENNNNILGGLDSSRENNSKPLSGGFQSFYQKAQDTKSNMGSPVRGNNEALQEREQN